MKEFSSNKRGINNNNNNATGCLCVCGDADLFAVVGRRSRGCCRFPVDRVGRSIRSSSPVYRVVERSISARQQCHGHWRRTGEGLTDVVGRIFIRNTPVVFLTCCSNPWVVDTKQGPSRGKRYRTVTNPFPFSFPSLMTGVGSHGSHPPPPLVPSCIPSFLPSFLHPSSSVRT